MRSALEGAACADLAPVAIERYFHSDASSDTFAARTGKAICARCVVLDECRTEAMNRPNFQQRGVVAGVSASEIARARSWRNYEAGITDSPPRAKRPSWLERSEAAETAEQTLVEAEFGVER